MNKHKSKALQEKCLCGDCPYKFECYTQERIFSDPIFQGLFEALIAQGMSKENALEEVNREIRLRIQRQAMPIASVPSIWDTAVSTPTWTTTTSTAGNVNITYTMCDGKEVSWNASPR